MTITQWMFLTLVVFTLCDNIALTAERPGSKAENSQPNIVLISIECLRYDHTPLGKYHRNTMPELTKFFNKGAAFTNVQATSSWTLPSLVSVFSSTYPFEHCMTTGGFHAPEGKLVMQAELPHELPWLPELLRQAGYRTYGFSTSPHTVTGTGFSRGFEYFDDKIVFKNAEVVNRQIQNKLKGLPSDQPFFLWIHYFDPHWQYWPTEPWIKRYTKERPELPADLYHIWVELLACERNLRPVDPLFHYLVASYDSEINFADKKISELLRQMNCPANTIYLVLSDHGEGFLEHGHMDHGNTLHEELLHVPVWLKWPAKKLKVKQLDDLLSLIDLAPTLLDLCDLETPQTMRGSSLRPRLFGEVPADCSRFVMSHLANFEVYESSIQSHRYKLIRNDATRELSVYDKQEDPLELKPLRYSENNKDLLFLRRVLEMEEKRHIPYKAVIKEGGFVVDERLEEELRQLGYVK